MADPVTWLAIATTASTASSIYSGNQAARRQKTAARAAATQAEAAQRQSEREFNRMNQKRPNVAAMMTANRAAGSGGVSGTFLTGTGGAPATGGMLGRTSLLGS
jgi:hypothetical protein